MDNQKVSRWSDPTSPGTAVGAITGTANGDCWSPAGVAERADPARRGRVLKSHQHGHCLPPQDLGLAGRRAHQPPAPGPGVDLRQTQPLEEGRLTSSGSLLWTGRPRGAPARGKAELTADPAHSPRQPPRRVPRAAPGFAGCNRAPGVGLRPTGPRPPEEPGRPPPGGVEGRSRSLRGPCDRPGRAQAGSVGGTRPLAKATGRAGWGRGARWHVSCQPGTRRLHRSLFCFGGTQSSAPTLQI